MEAPRYLAMMVVLVVMVMMVLVMVMLKVKMMMMVMMLMKMMMIRGGEFSIPGSMACSAAQDGNAEDIIPIIRTIITTIVITIIILLLTCGCSGTVV